jgi:hypothetical protein
MWIGSRPIVVDVGGAREPQHRTVAPPARAHPAHGTTVVSSLENVRLRPSAWWTTKKEAMLWFLPRANRTVIMNDKKEPALRTSRGHGGGMVPYHWQKHRHQGTKQHGENIFGIIRSVWSSGTAPVTVYGAAGDPRATCDGRQKKTKWVGPGRVESVGQSTVRKEHQCLDCCWTERERDADGNFRHFGQDGQPKMSCFHLESSSTSWRRWPESNSLVFRACERFFAYP